MSDHYGDDHPGEPVEATGDPSEPSATAPQRRGPSMVSRVLTLVGSLLIIGGLSMLAWVGWQMYGTNYVSQKKHEELVTAIEKQWAKGGQVTKTKVGTVDAVVRIPRFGKDYAVPLFEGVEEPALAQGYGRFPESALPGEVGNYSLAAHRVTHGEPLRRMPELQPGDLVYIDTAKWTYTYVLDTGGDDLRVDFKDVWVVDPLPKNPQPGGVQPAQKKGQRLLTLTTCAELFHTDERMIAFGHFVSKEKRAAAA